MLELSGIRIIYLLLNSSFCTVSNRRKSGPCLQACNKRFLVQASLYYQIFTVLLLYLKKNISPLLYWLPFATLLTCVYVTLMINKSFIIVLYLSFFTQSKSNYQLLSIFILFLYVYLDAFHGFKWDCCTSFHLSLNQIQVTTINRYKYCKIMNGKDTPMRPNF